MMEGDRGARPHRSMGVLTVEEKKFLLAVERGDVASVRRSVGFLFALKDFLCQVDRWLDFGPCSREKESAGLLVSLVSLQDRNI